MSHGRRKLLQLAQALGDGSDVDWERLATESSERERRLIEALAVLARMRRACAGLLTRPTPRPSDTPDSRGSPVDR